MKEKRYSNFELLRIFAIILVVMSHYICRISTETVGGYGEIYYAEFSPIVLVAYLIGGWGELGVTLFIFISSWFMVDKQGIHLKRILMIVWQTWTSCVVITGVICITGLTEISASQIVRELLTPLYAQY